MSGRVSGDAACVLRGGALMRVSSEIEARKHFSCFILLFYFLSFLTGNERVLQY